MPPDLAALVTARNEAGTIGDTLSALRSALPSARLLVADDDSEDDTVAVARRLRVEVVRAPRRLGKGGAATLGVRALLGPRAHAPTLLLCDGDLGPSAARLGALVEALDREGADVAVAAFARRVGGGAGLTVGAARRSVRSLTGLELTAPLSGQRALRARVIPAVLPFAPGFGMEVGMTVDAHRAGFRIAEVVIDLDHRATGLDARGFAHRGRQLLDVARARAARGPAAR